MIFFLLDKEKGGSLTVNDFEVAAKYGKWKTQTGICNCVQIPTYMTNVWNAKKPLFFF